jgi:dipeptidyl aminopeptidase/acylaminoacyl peptidase
MTARIFSLALLTLLASFARAEPPPVDSFFKDFQFRDFRLSPDGKSLAVLAPFKGAMNLFTFDLDARSPKVVTGESVDVSWFRWVNNERLIYRIESGEINEVSARFRGGIYAVNRDGSRHATLVAPFQGRRAAAISEPVTVGILHLLPESKDWVLVAQNERRRAYPDVFEMNVLTGRLRKQFNNPGSIVSYFTDSAGVVRGGVSFDLIRSSGEGEIWRRDPKTGDWSEVGRMRDFESEWEFVYMNADEDRALVAARPDGEDRTALYWLSLQTGELAEEPLLADPVYDVGPDVTGGQNRVLLGVRGEGPVGFFFERDRPVSRFLRDAYEKLQSILDESLPDAVNLLYDSDEKGTLAVVISISDRRSPAYFLLNLRSMEMELLGRAAPALDALPLQPHQPIVYTARDGREIHGYLTLPANGRTERVPLVLRPHGGPWARDVWGIRSFYDAERQFLANRGFAVLEMNFRGSTGYGDDHYRSSFKAPDQMHNDVIDAARWAVEEGIADPGRLGIMGASWGGYATMTALTKEPSMFQFGVNVFGVVDIPLQMDRYRKWGRQTAFNWWSSRIGDPSVPEELERLREWSAITHIEKLRAPVLIYHGIHDQNVHVEQTRLLESALKRKGWRAGVDYRIVIRTEEMHGLQNEAQRIAFYRELDDFLKPFAPAWQE